MLTWRSEVRHKRIKGFSCKKESWDFENRCFLYSERKNALLKTYVKKAWRITDDMDKWDYSCFVQELKRADEEKEPTQKKLFEYLKEIQTYYFENDQVAYSEEFRGLISFLKKCFTKDIRLQYFAPTQKKHLAYWVLGYKLFGVNFIDLAHLKCSDINNQYWKYKRSKTGIGSATGKPVPEAAMEILRQYDTSDKYILDVLNGYEENAERIHKRLCNYRANMRRTFGILSKRINFTADRYITWYTTRYTSITLTIEKGVDLNVVKTLADHASIKTTSKYVGIVKDRSRLREAMELL